MASGFKQVERKSKIKDKKSKLQVKKQELHKLKCQNPNDKRRVKIKDKK